MSLAGLPCAAVRVYPIHDRKYFQLHASATSPGHNRAVAWDPALPRTRAFVVKPYRRRRCRDDPVSAAEWCDSLERTGPSLTVRPNDVSSHHGGGGMSFN